jgi:peptidoglycan/xylan/chitin deacetylase (PgdA/CDA1 family)
MNSRKSFVIKSVLPFEKKTLLAFRSVFFIGLGLGFGMLLAACATPPSLALHNGTGTALAPAPIRFVLTFDDGPSAARQNNSTEQVLDVLANNNVQPGIKALFFTQTRATNGGGTAIGRALMQREYREGNLLGLHTATPGHTSHRLLKDARLNESLSNGIDDLTGIMGQPPKLVRPPYWNFDHRTFSAYRQHGLNVVLTDLSANDGKIWGVNWSFHKHSNLLNQLSGLKPRWLAGDLPVVDGSTPIIVTFHDVNTYTSNHIELYLQILVQVAHELDMPLADRPFYDERNSIEQAVLARAVPSADVRQKLPGIWDWVWE